MKRLIILIVLAAASFFGMQYFMVHAGDGLTVAQVFLDAGLVVKMITIGLNMLAAPVVGLGLISLIDRSGVARTMLGVAAWGAPAFGALGALYGVVVLTAGLKAIGYDADSRIWAPTAAEALMPLFAGFVVGSIAALFLLKKPPAPKPASA